MKALQQIFEILDLGDIVKTLVQPALEAKLFALGADEENASKVSAALTPEEQFPAFASALTSAFASASTSASALTSASASCGEQ